jgi:hypothetical protein
MADQSALQLYEVLEEEFINLHGSLPPGYPKDPLPELRTKAIIEAIHRLKEKRSAFCISGGGIRSATFGLGVMQGLARYDLLHRFDYISTVSGGGYIGSWLSSWIHRVSAATAATDSPEKEVAKALGKSPTSKLHPEPATVEHLREFSNYLAPKVSLLSADTWTLIAIYFRNLVLNWLVLVPLITAVLMIPRVYASIITNVRRHQLEDPGWMMFLLIAGVVLGAAGISYIGLNRPSGTRWNRTEKQFLLRCLTPLVLSAFMLTVFWAWYLDSTNGAPAIGLIHFVGFGVTINLLGFLAWAGFRIRSLGDARYRLRELIPVLVAGAVAGSLIWLVGKTPHFLFLPETGEAKLKTYVCLAVPVLLLIFLLGEILFVGLASLITRDEDREWWSREDAWILIVAIGWAAISSLVVFGPLGLAWMTAYVGTSVGGIAGLITLALGGSSSTPASKKTGEQGGAASFAKDIALKLAAPIFTIVLMVLLALAVTELIKIFDDSQLKEVINSATSRDFGLASYESATGAGYDHLKVLLDSPLKLVVLVMIFLIAISMTMARFININRFSLHSMYRNRLIRAYLGASNTNRSPNKFTNFDQNDNIPMHSMWPRNAGGKKRTKLFHVINMALNLVGGENLAWQERKAESFTVSSFHCGSSEVGYRRANEYGAGISIGTAMAISGAAASPNMGYNSSTFITFLMMLFNARLGWWLGNPGHAGDDTYRYEGPYFALKPLISETFGMTDNKSSYVYLSDGGHFENLGLYEMVRRRCHFIVVSDGSQDEEGALDSLGNAVRKIRIDMGIPIEFKDKMCIYPRNLKVKGKEENGKYCAVAEIRYSCVDGEGTDGILIYIKPAFYGNEPRDIYEYARANPAFPHESTADQFFTESQFESYRMLGSHIMEQICGEGSVAHQVNEFLSKSVGYLYPAPTETASRVPAWLDKWITPPSE